VQSHVHRVLATDLLFNDESARAVHPTAAMGAAQGDFAAGCICVYVWCVYLCGCVCMYLRISSVGCCAPGPVRPCACLSECMYVCVYVCICVRVFVLRMSSGEDIGNTSVFTQIPRNHGTITSIYQNIIWCRHYCGSFSFLMSYVYFCLCLSLCTFVPFLFSLSFPYKWCVR